MAATIDAANDIDASATTGNTNLNVAASFSVKSVDGNSNVAGATNQITIVFNCNTDLANGDTVVIAGLTFADDDNGEK
jgi:hypothetical protein